MLGKLMKHEFRAIGRIMLPIYAAWIVISLLLGITIRVNGNREDVNTFMIIGILLFVAIITIAGVMTLVLIVQRFSKGLLGNEGYLMLSVPATPAQHIWNKGLSSGIWSLFTGLIGIVSMIAIGIPVVIGEVGFLDAIGDALHVLSDYGIGKSVLVVIEFMALAVLNTTAFAFQIYTAISIGHQANKHQGALSVAAYVGLLVIEGIVGNVLGTVTGLGEFFQFDFNTTFGALQFGLLAIAIMLAVKGAIYYCITWYLTSNRPNLQ